MLRPDSSGTLTVVEHTVNKQVQTAAGEKRDTRETYSTNVPGVAGDDSLQRVQRETTLQRSTPGGSQRTVHQIEQPRPGESSDGLHLTQEAIDIVRPGASGTTDQSQLGTRHCFNSIADSRDNLLSLKPMHEVVSVDPAARTVTVDAGITYGQLCPYLDDKGFALHNLASLPHISVAGACSTATHGSGERNGNLATQVSALEFITASGDW